jgi:hypothetical protein
VDPLIVLRKLIERLGPEVGRVSHYTEIGRERGEAGQLHLIEAVIEACEALASGDPGRIRSAALICMALERDGGKMAVRAQRLAGGRRAAEVRSTAATREWAPFVAMYNNLLAAGKSPAIARSEAKKEMVRREFLLEQTGEFPGARAIRKWLPAPKKIKLARN